MNEDYNDPIREALEEAIKDESEYLKTLPAGSDERKKSTECFVLLHKAYCEDVNTASRLIKDDAEIELNKRKFLEDSRRAERETEVKEQDAAQRCKFYNQEWFRTAMVCATSLGTAVACMAVNAGDTPFRTALEKYILTLKPKV